jgi:hypothetical protein
MGKVSFFLSILAISHFLIEAKKITDKLAEKKTSAWMI